MLQEELTQDADYQREMRRYQQLHEKTMQSLRGDANDPALTEALDLQMVRLQLAELRWQVGVMTQSPGQLAAACDKTRLCVLHSKALIENAVRTNQALQTQIDHARAIIAESRRLLAGLDHAL
jgi:hypothetical protein